MAHRLENQIAIITGASRGIGLAIAQAYAAEGAKLCLIATDQQRLTEVKHSLGLAEDRIMTLAVNVTDRDACFDAVAKVTQHFGRVDVLVNNAGVYRSKTFLDYSPPRFSRHVGCEFVWRSQFHASLLARHARETPRSNCQHGLDCW